MNIDTLWRELVTTALLGTDRRPPPPETAGPIGDLVADAVLDDDAARMLTVVAATATVRRAAFLPLLPAAHLHGPEPDERPVIPPAAAATWETIVADWPVLEDEWMLMVIERGWRLSPDVLVQALVRHRRDPVRRARVAIAGGVISAWLVEHVPALSATTTRTPDVEAVVTLPRLAVAPELADPTRLAAGFESRAFGPAHRAVLVNVVARCDPDLLAATSDALARTGSGLAAQLSDLCRLRARMLAELGRRSPSVD